MVFGLFKPFEFLFIANKAAQDLAELVVAVWKKADIQNGEVALLGSIVTYYEYIEKQIIDILKKELPTAKLIKPRQEPAKGAAKLAVEMFF